MKLMLLKRFYILEVILQMEENKIIKDNKTRYFYAMTDQLSINDSKEETQITIFGFNDLNICGNVSNTNHYLSDKASVMVIRIKILADRKGYYDYIIEFFENNYEMWSKAKKVKDRLSITQIFKIINENS